MAKKKPLALFFPFDLLSHHLRCLEIANAIKANFEIKFCYSERYSKWAESAGFSTFFCAGFDPVKVMESVNKFDFSWLKIEELETNVDRQRKILKELQPSIVVGDSNPTLYMAAQAQGILCVNLLNAYMSNYYSVQRKISRVHRAARFEKKLPPQIWNFILKNAEAAAFRQVHRPFRKIRSRLWLPAKKSFLEEYEGDQTLICDLPEFFPLKNPPATLHTIGPLYFGKEKNSHEPGPGSAEESASRFLQETGKGLLVSMGSTGNLNHLHFLADERFHSWRIVISGEMPGEINGPHVLRFPFLHNSQVLKHAKLLICHGGNGTLYQALSQKTPVLCATSHFEQEWNLQRLEELGLGASLDGISSAEELENLLNHWATKKETAPFSGFAEKIQNWNTNGLMNLSKKFMTMLLSHQKSKPALSLENIPQLHPLGLSKK